MSAFFDITLGQRAGFRYAAEGEVRTAILQELRRWRDLPIFAESAERSRLAGAALADAEWIRARRGMVTTAVASDVREAALAGRWSIGSATPVSNTPNFRAYTKDHWSCLLYLETRIVDASGKVDRQRMNPADWKAIDEFVEDGLLIWGGTGMHPLFSFTPHGWAVAHSIRRWRAEGVREVDGSEPAGARASVASLAFEAVRS